MIGDAIIATVVAVLAAVLRGALARRGVSGADVEAIVEDFERHAPQALRSARVPPWSEVEAALLDEARRG